MLKHLSMQHGPGNDWMLFTSLLHNIWLSRFLMKSLWKSKWKQMQILYTSLPAYLQACFFFNTDNWLKIEKRTRLISRIHNSVGINKIFFHLCPLKVWQRGRSSNCTWTIIYKLHPQESFESSRITHITSIENETIPKSTLWLRMKNNP